MSLPFLSFFFLARTLPDCFATIRAYLSPHALHRSFCPLSPLRHSALSVVPQLAQHEMPLGGFPPFRSCSGSLGRPEAESDPPPEPPRMLLLGRVIGIAAFRGTGFCEEGEPFVPS